MAIRRSQNWLNQQRIDTPHLRSIESAVRNDFDELIRSFVLGEDVTYVLRGFEIAMEGSIGSSANSLQLIVEEGSIFHATSDTSGTFFVVPSGTANEPLNTTTNTKVVGSFTSNALNYVGLEYVRQVDDTTTSQVYLWNPTSKNEITKTLPLAETLDYRIIISSSSFASNVLPLAIVQTNSSNNVQTIQDRRPLLFRLGTAGADTPNPFHTYGWDNQPEGRTENFWSSSSSSSSPFRGGDKQILTLKEWMDATMSSIKEIKGTTYWYSENIGGSVVKARQDIANTVITGRGTISHSALTPGLINWSDDIFLTVISSRLRFEVSANAASNDIVLSDDEVAYIDLIRDQLIIPNLIFTQGSPDVESVGSVNWTDDIVANDYIRVASEDFTKYYQVLSVDSTIKVTLKELFAEASTGAAGTQAMYAWGTYVTDPAPSTSRHIKTAARKDVPFTEDTYWFLVRQDNADATPNVYARFLGENLELGESQDINNSLPQAVKSYIGMFDDADSTPDYGEAAGNNQVTTIESVPAADITSGQYFTINSANDANQYYVWFDKDASGGDPAPIGLTPIVVAVIAADTAIDVSIATAAAISAVNSGADFSVPVPTTIYSVVTNIAQGSSTNAANVDVGGSFEVGTTTQGFDKAISGQQDYFTKVGENLTSRISKLTSMMADKAQDKTMDYMLKGVYNISNVVNSGNAAIRDISFSGEPSPNKTLTMIAPSTGANVTVVLDGTLSIGVDQVAYFVMDRNNPTNIADISSVLIANISSLELSENIFIFAYRLGDDVVNLWNGREINNYLDSMGLATATSGVITNTAASTITTGQYFNLYVATDFREYYVWFNKDGLGGDPTPVAKLPIEVAIISSDSAIDIAGKVHAAVNVIPFFTTIDNGDGTVNYENSFVGYSEDPANVNVGGTFSIAVTNQGTGEFLHYIENGDLKDVAIKKLDEVVKGISTFASDVSTIVNQNENIKLINGGTFSWDLGSTTLTWSAPAQVQIPTLQNERNNILAGNAVLANDGDVAYASISRLTGPDANISITVANIDAISLNDSVIIFARRVGNDVIVGTGTDVLQDQEYLTLDGALQEINRYFGQLRIQPHLTDGDRVVITGSDIFKLNGSLISQAVKNLLLSFDGAEVDMANGTIYESDGITSLGLDFSPVLPTGTDYKWYSLTLIPSTVNIDNTINAQISVLEAATSAATAEDAVKPKFAKGTQLGLVYIQGDGAGSIEAITNDNIKQLGVGGGGSGSGSISELPYGEDLLAGDLVQLYDNGGIPTVKNISEPISAVPDGTSWNSYSAIGAESWSGIAYNDGFFVAVSGGGAGNRFMRSIDGGLNWTASSSTSTENVTRVTYGNGVFVAVSNSKSVVSSDNGDTWTEYSLPFIGGSAADIAYSNGVFILTSSGGSGRITRSTDNGQTWTQPTIPTLASWDSITYGNGVFVVIEYNGDRVMRSTDDGLTWILINSGLSSYWRTIAYGDSAFIAVAGFGTYAIMRSTDDGLTWTSITPTASTAQWIDVVYGDGMFTSVAGGGSGDRTMISTDDGLTWTSNPASVNNNWTSLAYGDGNFVSVTLAGTDRVMVSEGVPSYVIFSPELFFGIVQEDGLLSETHEVAVLSEVSEVHSGQIAGEIAYIQDDGTLGSVITGYPVGRYATPETLNLTLEPISEFFTGGGGNELLERAKNRLNSGDYDVVTPVIFSAVEETLADPATTADYSNADRFYEFPLGNEQFTSVQLLDTVFLSENKDVADVELVAYWDLDTLDATATYELSRDGGNEYQVVAMDRIGQSDTFYTTYSFTEEATFSDTISNVVEDSDLALTNLILKRGQAFTVADQMTIKQLTLNASVIGTLSGSVCIQLVKDVAGLPSELDADLLFESAPQDLSGLVAGDTDFVVACTVPVSAGDYHLVIVTDLEYQSNYSVGVDELRVRANSADLTPDSTSFTTTPWIDSTAGKLMYVVEGRVLDLKVRITGSTVDARLLGFATFYDRDNSFQISTQNLDRQVFIFSGDDNVNTFAISGFTPDPILMTSYETHTGQAYRNGAWTLNGSIVEFPANTFNKPGETITLEFLQVFKGSLQFDSINRAIIAENHLGSQIASQDLSSAGRGIILRRPDGTLRELTINDADGIDIKTVP